jgi:hypothetical protein
MAYPSIHIDFRLAYDLATISPARTSTATPGPVKSDTSRTVVAVNETFHPLAPSSQISLPSSQSAPCPIFRYRRHTTSSKPYFRLPDSSESTSPDPAPKPEVVQPTLPRTRHLTAPPASLSLDPLLIELLDHLASLYRAVWKRIREGFTLAEALEHFHLTSDMWNTRRLIAETWITFRDIYRANLLILNSLYGTVPRGLVMFVLKQTALKTLNHWTRKRKLMDQRRAGNLMSM